jgi:hypothetical protein
MSQENVERTRRLAKVLNEGDLQGFLALMDDRVETGSRLAAIEGGYHGHEGIRRWWENVHDAFPDFRLDVREFRDLGDVTLVAADPQGHGAGSSIPVAQAQWIVVRWASGKAVRWASFRSEAEALEAVGLSE